MSSTTLADGGIWSLSEFQRTERMMSANYSSKMKKLFMIFRAWRTPLVVAIVNGIVLAPMACYGWLFSSIQSAVNATAVQTGWIGAMASSSNYMSGPIAVVVEGYLGYRLTTVLGSTLSALFILLSSYVANYLGILLFYGVGYGLSSGLAFHATVCTLFKVVDKSSRSNMSSIVFSFVSLSTVFLSVVYEWLIPLAGWEFTLRFTSAYILLLGVPLSCLLGPAGDKKFKVTSVSVQTDVTPSLDVRNPSTSNAVERSEDIPSISGEVEKAEMGKTTGQETDDHKGWLDLVRHWKSWMILAAITTPAMAWTTYWIYTVSYFESLGLSEGDILLNITIITVFEVVGRLGLAFVGSKLPIRDVSQLILLNIIFVLVTSFLASLPPQSALLACCVLIGIGRGWTAVLSYGASADLLREGYSVDKNITLTMIALGIGFTFGSLPTGAIYDATNSYAYAFLVNALFYLFGATILVLLQVRRRCAKVKEIRRFEDKIREEGKATEVTCEPCVNYAYEHG